MFYPNFPRIIVHIALLLYYQVVPSKGLAVLAQKKLSFIESGGWSHAMPTCDFACQSRTYVPSLQWLGENLSKGSGPDWCTREGIYKHWQSSPKHREVLDEQKVLFEVFRIAKKNDTCYAVLERGK